MNSRFAGGRNIALKVPPHQYDATVQFYRDVLGLKVLENHLPAVGFEFGSNQLWDRSSDGTQPGRTLAGDCCRRCPGRFSLFQGCGCRALR